ncbi:hypothetical protein K7H91_11975 [Martelella mediterranea]|uniref:hypothetical protein n=1 Tax=Martelella mediterranea TaxID=293089 RepID=UPI001E484AFF|nr:hypothetical protein [Martelella mediterranea]MCD1634490.1 hypothetical protein [Martelella mediterranea]
MKFILNETNRYWWPVKVRMPDTDNPGKFATYELEILFEPESQDKAIARLEAAAKLTAPRERMEHERKQLFDVCKDWRGVEDDDERALTFNADNFGRAINQSWFRQAVYNAYADSLNGEEARLGN